MRGGGGGGGEKKGGGLTLVNVKKLYTVHIQYVHRMIINICLKNEMFDFLGSMVAELLLYFVNF